MKIRNNHVEIVPDVLKKHGPHGENYEAFLQRDHATKKAEEGNFLIVLPQSNQLLVDIDSEGDFLVMKSLVDLFHTYVCPIAHMSYAPSPSGEPGHYHVTVTLTRNVESMGERIFFQLLLASDRKRELLSFARIGLCIENPTLFFEKRERTLSETLDNRL